MRSMPGIYSKRRLETLAIRGSEVIALGARPSPAGSDVNRRGLLEIRYQATADENIAH
jgi:hypothetical protein